LGGEAWWLVWFAQYSVLSPGEIRKDGEQDLANFSVCVGRVSKVQLALGFNGIVLDVWEEIRGWYLIEEQM